MASSRAMHHLADVGLSFLRSICHGGILESHPQAFGLIELEPSVGNQNKVSTSGCNICEVSDREIKIFQRPQVLIDVDLKYKKRKLRYVRTRVFVLALFHHSRSITPSKWPMLFSEPAKESSLYARSFHIHKAPFVWSFPSLLDSFEYLSGVFSPHTPWSLTGSQSH